MLRDRIQSVTCGLIAVGSRARCHVLPSRREYLPFHNPYRPQPCQHYCLAVPAAYCRLCPSAFLRRSRRKSADSPWRSCGDGFWSRSRHASGRALPDFDSPFYAGCMLVRPHDGGIDGMLLVGWWPKTRQGFECGIPHAELAPACEAHKDRIPITVSLGHVAPRSAGAQSSEAEPYDQSASPALVEVRSLATSKANPRFELCRSYATTSLPASSACNDSAENWADVRGPSCFKDQ